MCICVVTSFPGGSTGTFRMEKHCLHPDKCEGEKVDSERGREASLGRGPWSRGRELRRYPEEEAAAASRCRRLPKKPTHPHSALIPGLLFWVCPGGAVSERGDLGGAARSPGAGMLGAPGAVLTRGHWRVKLACPGFLSLQQSSQDFLFKMHPRPAPPLTLARLVTGEIPRQPFEFTLFSRLPLPKRTALSSSSHPCYLPLFFHACTIETLRRVVQASGSQTGQTESITCASSGPQFLSRRTWSPAWIRV